MLKSRKDAYDGRGNYPVKSPADISDALEALAGKSLYAEKWANFRLELAVMVVKTENDTSDCGRSTIAYSVVETVHEDSVCKLVYAPPRDVSIIVQNEAQDLARKAVGSFPGKGVFGVELFLLPDGELLLVPQDDPLREAHISLMHVIGQLIVNEIAPRPHNSGHWTIEGCPTMSQFKSQLLAILGLMPSFPNSTIPAMFPATVMLNILGGKTQASHNKLMNMAIAIPAAALHMYGKDSKPGRKIGHITVVGSSSSEAEALIAPLITVADDIRAERKGLQRTASIPSSPVSAARPLVAVTMGSDSDLPVLKPGLALLTTLGIPFHVTITSAHRTPQRMTDFANSASSKGFKVIIAAAGGAAHLPGMIAASTPLPVIGVPVKGRTLDGMDSLLSIVQMPRGVPVATVAINNSVNAALLAARILGAHDGAIQQRLVEYAATMGEEVVGKAGRLEDVGFEGY